MRNREIPRGQRDLLPEEVKVKRKIENRIAGVFKSYGYEEVITPAFEYLEVVETGTANLREELFLFTGREGGILVLRPEMTVAIARLAATHLQDEEFPQRLYYIANVFRHVQPQLAQYREFWQMGIELLGASGVWADAEVITMAVKSLREIDLPEFKISLNQIGIFNSLLDDSGLSAGEREQIRTLVENKDLVELTRVLEGLAVEDGLKETIANLPVLHGGIEVLEQLPYVEKNAGASAAVNDLLKVYDALALCGVKDNVVLDMGVLRGLDYYTGIVFEGYSPELGYGLLGGGRYDRLLGQFGLPRPATGFALGLDRLAMVLKHQDEQLPCFLVGGDDPVKILETCNRLRAAGNIAKMDIEKMSKAELEKKAARNGLAAIYCN